MTVRLPQANDLQVRKIARSQHQLGKRSRLAGKCEAAVPTAVLTLPSSQISKAIGLTQADHLQVAGVAIAQSDLRKFDHRKPVMIRGPITVAPGVVPHDAGRAVVRTGGAKLAVAIRQVVDAPGTTAVALAFVVFVGRLKNVAGLVGKDAINISRPPIVIGVLLNEARSADSGVSEIRGWVFDEESRKCPLGAQSCFDMVDVVV